MGDLSLELQILNYINGKGKNVKALSLEKIEKKIDEFKIPTTSSKETDEFDKAKKIAKAWLDPFAGEKEIPKDKFNLFAHSLASIDDNADIIDRDTNDNISERHTVEAFSESQDDLKKIGEADINAFQSTGRTAQTYEAIKKGILFFSKKIRTLVECIIRDAILDDPPTPTYNPYTHMTTNGGKEDWNRGGSGTRTLQAENKKRIDEVLVVDEAKPATDTAKEIKITNNGATLEKGGEVVINESMLQIDNAAADDLVMIKEIKGGSLFYRDKTGKNILPIKPNNDDGAMYKFFKPGFLGSQENFEVVFKQDGSDSSDAGFDFTITDKDEKEKSTKQPFKITVNGAASTTEVKDKTTSDIEKGTEGNKTKVTDANKNKTKADAKTSTTNDFETEAASNARKAAGIAKNVAGTNYPEYSNTIAAQFKLRSLDPTLAIDGFWGPKTQAAFDKWKTGKAADAKLLVEGEVNKYGVIFDTEFASAYSKETNTSNQVKKIQAFLKIAQNGNYDATTVAKVKAFQSANGLVADGIWGPITTAKAMSLTTGAFGGF